MPKSKSLCGAVTKSQSTCRIAVETAGDRCHIHNGHPLGPKRAMDLMWKVIDRVAALGGAYGAFELAHPAITAIWKPLRGWLMPEYFWHYGFEPKDKKRMNAEIDAAHRKSKELELRYSHYPPASKLALEKAYREILREVESRESLGTSRQSKQYTKSH